MRIPLFHVTAGAGHLRAAEAVGRALIARGAPPSPVLDFLDFTNPLFKRVYPKTYMALANKGPNLLNILYQKSDAIIYDEWRARLRIWFDRLNTRPLLRMLQEIGPDVIACTHFLPLEIFSELRRRGHCSVPLVGILTDTSPHAIWAYPDVTLYCVANDLSVRELVRRGVPASRIRVTGIPVDPDIPTVRPQHEVRARLGLPDKPTVLVLSGGYGMGSLEEIVRSFGEATRDMSLILVAGHNRELKARMERWTVDLSVSATVFGYVNGLSDLIDASDLVVTKPGGLTTSELLSKGKPMALVNPIPGQEERNADYLLEHGAAIRIHDNSDACYRVETLLDDPAWMGRLERSARSIARPDAADRIGEILMDIAVRERRFAS